MASYDIYIKKAQELGYDMSNPSTAHALIEALQYCEARFNLPPGNGSRLIEGIAKATGWTEDSVRAARGNPFIPLASQIVAEIFIQQLAESDTRKQLMGLFHNDFVGWYSNMSRIAGGKANNKGAYPSDRDQIMAFQALTGTRVSEVFERLLFAPEQQDVNQTPEMLHLKAQRLLGSSNAVVLDGEIVPEASKGSPLPASPSQPQDEHSSSQALQP